MRSMSNLEYSVAARELQLLAGSRLDKLYDMGNGEFRMRFRASGKYEDVCVKLGERIHFTRYIRDAPKEPSNLAMFLRKRIEGLRVGKVGQHGFDRVIFFGFGTENDFLLVFEMFADGNLLLLDGKGKIIRCFRREEWKDRALKEGQEYKFPQSNRLSPPFSPEALEGIVEGKPLISSLSSKTNFGNDYLEEACRRAGVDLKAKGSEAGKGKLEALCRELNSMSAEPGPLLYLKDGKPVDFSVAALGKYSSLESAPKKTLSEAVDECANAGAEAQAPVDVEGEKKRGKLLLRLKKQEERVIEMLKEADELKAKGDSVYARYQEVEEILAGIREMRKNGEGWAEIKKKFSGKCEIDEHAGTVFLS